MWAPLTSKSSRVCALAAQAAPRVVVAVDRRGDDAGLRRPAPGRLQPFGQPGAAGGDAHQPRVGRGAAAARRAPARGTAPRRRGSARRWRAVVGSRQAPQELFQDDAGGAGVGVARRRRPGPRWCCSARPPRTPACRSGRAAGGRTCARAPYCRGWRRRDGTARPPPAHRAAIRCTRCLGLRQARVVAFGADGRLRRGACAACGCPPPRRCA